MREVFKENWKRYIEIGLVAFPCPRGTKGPIIRGWSKNPPPKSYAVWSQKNAADNLWVRLDALVVLEPDSPEAEAFLPSLGVPECPLSFSGNKSVHRWFSVNGHSLKPLKLANGLELRTGPGQGMLVPPSIHPKTAKPYEWVISPWEWKEQHGVYFPNFPVGVYEKIKGLVQKPKPIEENGFSEGNGFNVARYLDAYEIRYKTKQESTRTIYALSRCLFAAAHTTKDVKGDSSIIQGSDGKLGYHCFHAHCDGRTWKDARQAISGDASIARFFRGNKTPKLTPLMNARQLESMEFPEVAPVIDSGILPSQTGMVFAGPSGVGKSIIAIEWGIRLCHGMDILSFRVPEARRVLMIQKENALAQVKHRIRQICGGLKLSHAPENLFMTSVEERFNLRKSEDLEKLAGYIEMAKAETCILDPLSSFHSNDENDNIAMRNILDRLTEISRRQDVAFIIVHHYGKSNEYRGATAIRDWADTLIGFEERTDSERDLRFLKVRNGPRPKTIVVEMDGNFLHQIVGGSTYYVKKVMEELDGQVGSIKELAKALMDKFGYHERTARGYIYDALKDGLIERKEDLSDRRKKVLVLKI